MSSWFQWAIPRGSVFPKFSCRSTDGATSLVLEELEEGVFLYRQETAKLSWQETYRAMVAEREDWSDFDVTVADGVD